MIVGQAARGHDHQHGAAGTAAAAAGRQRAEGHARTGARASPLTRTPVGDGRQVFRRLSAAMSAIHLLCPLLRCHRRAFTPQDIHPASKHAASRAPVSLRFQSIPAVLSRRSPSIGGASWMTTIRTSTLMGCEERTCWIGYESVGSHRFAKVLRSKCTQEAPLGGRRAASLSVNEGSRSR
eukprot:2381640-Prymnesium_polylepis.1